jgi:hypothetical protein
MVSVRVAHPILTLWTRPLGPSGAEGVGRGQAEVLQMASL